MLGSWRSPSRRRCARPGMTRAECARGERFSVVSARWCGGVRLGGSAMNPPPGAHLRLPTPQQLLSVSAAASPAATGGGEERPSCPTL
jgi:hypothetical protein